MNNRPDALFFLSDLPGVGEEIEIRGDEAGHILKSRRFGEGASISLTDGRGRLANASITSVSERRDRLAARIRESRQVPPRPVRLMLAAAIPKGERQGIVLDMGTQMGMDEYLPLHCNHEITRYHDKMRERWQRLLVSAAKQSRRCYFPKVASPVTLAQAIDSSRSGRLVVVADPQGVELPDLISPQAAPVQEMLGIVGPEGGFSDDEKSMINNSRVIKLKLAPDILRVETAAIALLAAMNQWVARIDSPTITNSP